MGGGSPGCLLQASGTQGSPFPMKIFKMLVHSLDGLKGQGWAGQQPGASCAAPRYQHHLLLLSQVCCRELARGADGLLTIHCINMCSGSTNGRLAATAFLGTPSCCALLLTLRSTRVRGCSPHTCHEVAPQLHHSNFTCPNLGCPPHDQRKWSDRGRWHGQLGCLGFPARFLCCPSSCLPVLLVQVLGPRCSGRSRDRQGVTSRWKTAVSPCLSSS